MISDDYVCAVDGQAGEALEEPDGELDDLPVGWASLTVSRRVGENPEWVMIQDAKAALVARQLQDVPPEHQEDARPFAELMARAQFAALEKETPRYLDVVDQVHVSAANWRHLAELLGLEDDDGDDGDDGEQEAPPALAVVPTPPAATASGRPKAGRKAK